MTGRPRRLPLLLGLARAALFWENLWPRLWPAVSVVVLFAALALMDVLPLLPGWLHLIVLLGLAALLARLAVYALPGFRAVPRHRARLRLERDSGLAHRPLETLEDHLPEHTDDPAAVALWAEHRRRMAARVRGLRLGLPSPGVPARDVWGLRIVAPLLLVIGVFAAGSAGDPLKRFDRALSPRFAVAAAVPTVVDVWITPPAHTGRAPVFLGHGGPHSVAAKGEGDSAEAPDTAPESEKAAGPTADNPLVVPIGSTVLAQVSGGGGQPDLDVGGTVTPFDSLGRAGPDGPATYRAQAEVTGGDRLAVVGADGQDVVAWPIKVLGDNPPTVSLVQPADATHRAHLRLAYRAEDDNGVTGLAAIIERPDGAALPDGATALRLDMMLPDPGAKEATGQSVHDLTAHVWAGLTVRLTLEAKDARGQTGTSAPATVVLPERTFHHPVAREIIAARKQLAMGGVAARGEGITRLMSILRQPGRFNGDTVVYLSLGVARSRLFHDATPRGVATVIDLLWDTALRLEDGKLSIAERRLSEAEEALRQAMRDGASPEEIERLMQELQQALNEYLEALAESLQDMDPSQQAEGMRPPDDVIRSQDLRKMLDQARDMARTGSMEAAQRMLDQLRQQLDRLRSGRPQGANQRAMAEAQQLMDGMRELTRRQQELMDQTFRQLNESRQRNRQAGDGQRGARRMTPEERRQAAEGAAQQEALRRQLGEMMRRMDSLMGQIPGPMGQAERSMRGARDALGRGNQGQAVSRQGEALESLREAMEGMAEQMARALGGLRPGQGQGQGRGQAPGNQDMPSRDPMGREQGGPMGTATQGGDVKVPDEMELQRAHDVLRELRRRAGQHDRPRIERDYIDRLLKRF